MASEWRMISARDFCNSVRDGTHDSPKPVQNGRHLVTSRHIIGGRVDLSDAYLISQDDFDSINKRSKVDKWDVLVSMIGTVGEPCLIRDEPDFAIKNIGLFKSKGESEGKWLYYYLRSPKVRQLIREQSRGTTQAYIPLGALREFPILVPDDPSEMKAIAFILGALDDKIELNRRMNSTIETTARAIFKSWFVYFDPVRAKAEGQKSPGLASHIADLFPDAFEESELGEIPRGWRVQAFNDGVDVIGGGTPKTSVPDFWGGDIPWFSVVDTPSPGEIFVISTEKLITKQGLNSSSTRILPVGTTIISARGTVGNLAFVGVPMAMNQSCYGLYDRRGGCGYFLYFATGAVIEILRQRAHGSVFNTITRDTLTGVRVVAPPDALVAAFERVVDSFLQRILSALYQSRTLSALRDILLPRLISGKLKISDAERIIGRTF